MFLHIVPTLCEYEYKLNSVEYVWFCNADASESKEDHYKSLFTFAAKKVAMPLKVKTS